MLDGVGGDAISVPHAHIDYEYNNIQVNSKFACSGKKHCYQFEREKKTVPQSTCSLNHRVDARQNIIQCSKYTQICLKTLNMY